MKYIYGIDIGGTTIKMGLFAEDGTLKEKWEIKTRTEDNGKNIISDIATAVNDHMKENDLTREDVIGIGAGVPGAVFLRWLPPATLLWTCHLGTPCLASCSQPTSFIKYTIFSIGNAV